MEEKCLHEIWYFLGVWVELLPGNGQHFCTSKQADLTLILTKDDSPASRRDNGELPSENDFHMRCESAPSLQDATARAYSTEPCCCFHVSSLTDNREENFFSVYLDARTFSREKALVRRERRERKREENCEWKNSSYKFWFLSTKNHSKFTNCCYRRPAVRMISVCRREQILFFFSYVIWWENKSYISRVFPP